MAKTKTKKPAQKGGKKPAGSVKGRQFGERRQALEDAVNTAVAVQDRRTVEERYADSEAGWARRENERACAEQVSRPRPAKKPSLWHRFRSAITGLFVSRAHAEANPDTTVRERVR